MSRSHRHSPGAARRTKASKSAKKPKSAPEDAAADTRAPNDPRGAFEPSVGRGAAGVGRTPLPYFELGAETANGLACALTGESEAASARLPSPRAGTIGVRGADGEPEERADEAPAEGFVGVISEASGPPPGGFVTPATEVDGLEAAVSELRVGVATVVLALPTEIET
jgi:hypothetical protein